jgi:large subunit ribosomal protein L29
MKVQELREQTVEQLSEKLAELKIELFNLRFQHVIKQLGNPMQIKAVKKDIARIKTIVTQKKNQKGEKEV